jgi:hypothetical protein
MLEIFGKNYYIDVEQIIDKCRPEYPTTIKNSNNENDEQDEGTLELNVFKFECLKACIERLLNEYDETDDSMPMFAAKSTNTSFRIAFNTLLKNEILTYDDDDE